MVLGTHEKIDNELVDLLSDHPEEAERISVVRAYLRDLQPQAQLRELLREMVGAITDSAHLGADVRAVLERVQTILERIAVAEEECARAAREALVLEERSIDRRSDSLKSALQTVGTAAKSGPAWIIWTSMAWAVADWLGVIEYLTTSGVSP